MLRWSDCLHPPSTPSLGLKGSPSSFCLLPWRHLALLILNRKRCLSTRELSIPSVRESKNLVRISMLSTGGRGQRAAGARREAGGGWGRQFASLHLRASSAKGEPGVLRVCVGSEWGSVQPVGSGRRAVEGMQTIAPATPAIHHGSGICTVIWSNCSYRFHRELKAGKSRLESSKLWTFSTGHIHSAGRWTGRREKEREFFVSLRRDFKIHLTSCD